MESRVSTDRPEESPKIASSKKRKCRYCLWFLLAAVLLGSGYGYRVYQRHIAHETKREAEALREIQACIDSLKIGPELLHHDGYADRRITELRMDVYEKQGISRVLPYYSQVTAEPYILSRQAKLPQTPFSWIEPKMIPAEISRFSSMENILLTNAHAAVGRIRGWLQRPDSNCTHYLKSHPNIYNLQIRPRLLLMTQSLDERLAFEACSTLLAAGETSDIPLRRLQGIAHGRYMAQDAEELLKRYHLPRPAPWPTVNDLPVCELEPEMKINCLSPIAADSEETKKGYRRKMKILGKTPEATGVYVVLPEKKYSFPRRIAKVDFSTQTATPLKLDGVGEIYTAGVSKDGTLMATNESRPLTPHDETLGIKKDSKQFLLTLWNTQTGKETGRLAPLNYYFWGHGQRWLCFSPDNNQLWAGGQELLTVYDLKKKMVKYRFNYEGCFSPFFLNMPPRGKLYGYGVLENGRLLTWGVLSNQNPGYLNSQIRYARIAKANVHQWVAGFSYENDLSGYTCILRIWDFMDLYKRRWKGQRRVVARYPLEFSHKDEGYFLKAIFSPKDQYLLTLRRNGRKEDSPTEIIFWTLKGKPLGRLSAPADPLVDIYFCGEKLLAADKKGTLYLWDWAKLKAYCESQAGGAAESKH